MTLAPPDFNAWCLDDDLNDILERAVDVLVSLKGARLFFTGGTGFIGRWLLESLRHVDARLDLGVSVTILTRDPAGFAARAPHLAQHPAFTLQTGDICDFALPEGEYSHLIHAATEASASLNEHNPLRMFDTITQGTRQALKVAAEKRVERMLFLSSGAVYGQQPWEMERVHETWNGSPSCTDPKAAYGEGKRAAEMLCAIYGKQFSTAVVTARIFALLGPLLPLGTHFAAGNFIGDAMAGKPVIVNGNGLPCRSYLYPSDLTVWLWHLLLRGTPGTAYNVGSDESTSIRHLAERVATVLAQGEFQILDAADTGWNPGRYVPDISRIRNELGMVQTVGLDEAILRTALWNGWKGKV